MTKSEKIFIGVVTFARDEQYLSSLINHINAQTESDWSIHFIDTTICTGYSSESYAPRLKEYLRQHLSDKSWTVTEYTTKRLPGEAKYLFLVRCRNILREQFLASGATYYFSIDSDVMIPPNTFSLLLSHNAPAVSGVYLTTMNLRDKNHPEGITKITPVAVVRDPMLPADCVRPLLLNSLLEPKVIPILAAGLGCVLISRDVFEKIPVRFNAEECSTDDFPFYLDMEKAGFTLLLDTRVLCAHLKYPIGDERNKMLDFANYKIQIKPKQ